MSKCRKFSPELKREAVELTRLDGITFRQIATDPGIGAAVLSRWRREQERDLLHEAAAFFAKASK